ncbi:MAG: selenide, water dikinase SelD [Bacteroidetes bacterium]|nr:selenide, water dikinase SelD [Bacteroidota bacterium]
METSKIKLTAYSHGAGCGCKIAPSVLEKMLQSDAWQAPDAQLLVGNSSRDDAAVYDLGNGTALISTTDFFTPIVDDAFDFGRIAAANAISDVYAMGGKPLMAIAILGWPVEQLPPELAQQVLAGGRSVCTEAGIPLAGGHSIDTTEPVFGLAVSGTLPVQHLKRNNTAQSGDLLLLTKPLGVGILATAQKRGIATAADMQIAIAQMATLNKVGEKLGEIKGVTAMTDITGFGLLGHLIEMCEGASLSATLHYNDIPVITAARTYLAQRAIPDATYRNWNSYSSKVAFETGVDVMEAFNLLPDPQTNGGLLIAVQPQALQEVQDILAKAGLEKHTMPIGSMHTQKEKLVTVAG